MGCAVAALLVVPGTAAVTPRPGPDAPAPVGPAALPAPPDAAGAREGGDGGVVGGTRGGRTPEVADLLGRGLAAVPAPLGVRRAAAGQAALPLLPSPDDLAGIGPASVTRLAPTGEGDAVTATGPTTGGRGAGRVFVAGDSLTATSLDPGRPGPGSPADLVVASGLGWTASDVQPHLDAALAEGPIDALVVALGTNDSAPPPDYDGWTDADVEAFRRLVGTVPDTACVVMVLPGYGAGADPARDEPMRRARLALWALADERSQGDWYGPTVVLDWQERIDSRPDLLGGDGIHLAPLPGVAWARPDVAAVRTALYWEGVAACGPAAP